MTSANRRDDSPKWQAAAHIDSRRFRTSTGHESLEAATAFTEHWYLQLHSKALTGAATPEEKTSEPTFAEVAEMFLHEYTTIAASERSPKWVESHAIRLRLYLLPFFGNMGISQINSSTAQEYRVWRMTPPTEKNPHSLDTRRFVPKVPARKTLHNEIVTLRLVLKTAVRHGLIVALPDLSPPYRGRNKVTHRPWFSPAEYKQLYEATRAYTKAARPREKWYAEQLHDYVLFMANTGLRPDEAALLQHRDVEIVEDEDTGETILVIEVRGKRGVGYCKSTRMAVRPYHRLLARPKPQKNPDGTDALPEANDLVFPTSHIKMFNGVLNRTGLKRDRDGNARTSYSLRHTYICLRLMEGADIYQIAKNCRTSVDMIEKHYAAHIKTTLDAAAINRMRLRMSNARGAGSAASEEA